MPNIPSPEFTSLQKTSQLPDWLSGERALDDYWMLVMGGTHGDEQDQVAYVRSRMEDDALPPGVLPIIAHREAADAGQRSIGKNPQLMWWYPGNFNGDTVEDRTAAGITWLINKLPDDHLVMDRHDGGGYRYVYVSPTTNTATLAAAHIMQHATVMFSTWSPFYNNAPLRLGAEETVPSDPADKLAYFEAADQQLELIASLGNTGLREYYHDNQVGEQFTSFERFKDVMLIDHTTRQPDPEILSILPELEAIEVPNGSAAPITLSPRAREVLRVPKNANLFMETPGYMHRAPIIGNATLGLSDDKLRRICWAALLIGRDRPQAIPGTDLVTFRGDND